MRQRETTFFCALKLCILGVILVMLRSFDLDLETWKVTRNKVPLMLSQRWMTCNLSQRRIMFPKVNAIRNGSSMFFMIFTRPWKPYDRKYGRQGSKDTQMYKPPGKDFICENYIFVFSCIFVHTLSAISVLYKCGGICLLLTLRGSQYGNKNRNGNF
jgi:hypothetical protein